jgi:hypothetical protein
MMQTHPSRIATLIAVALLTSCAGRVIPQSSGATTADVAAATAKPPSCPGQTDASDYSTLQEPMEVNGGQLCIPSFGGWGGTFAYPKIVTGGENSTILGSSTTDYNGTLKLPVHGKPLFYLQIAFGLAGHFAKTVASAGALYGPALKAHEPYTFFGSQLGSITTKFAPCYSIATKGKYGIGVSGLGALLENASVQPENSVIELFKKKLTKKRC